jgi:hypothetical protein
MHDPARVEFLDRRLLNLRLPSRRLAPDPAASTSIRPDHSHQGPERRTSTSKWKWSAWSGLESGPRTVPNGPQLLWWSLRSVALQIREFHPPRTVAMLPSRMWNAPMSIARPNACSESFPFVARFRLRHEYASITARPRSPPPSSPKLGTAVSFSHATSARAVSQARTAGGSRATPAADTIRTGASTPQPPSSTMAGNSSPRRPGAPHSAVLRSERSFGAGRGCGGANVSASMRGCEGGGASDSAGALRNTVTAIIMRNRKPGIVRRQSIRD